MQAKDFQREALERLGEYLVALAQAKRNWDEDVAYFQSKGRSLADVPDFTVAAWNSMLESERAGRAWGYSARRTGAGEPTPCVTFKVPTGGGKTFIAVQAVTKILEAFTARDEERVVLWVVPSEAIYSQTKRHLLDRDGPLRRALDVASGNRVRILEKDSPLHRADLEGHLTILLLMLPSTNRTDADKKLRLFRDRGNVNGFLPPEDDFLAHDALHRQVPNLDRVGMGDLLAEEPVFDQGLGLIRSSLGNALRLLRPVLVLDEGHKGFAEKSYQAIYNLNPRFVLELSATPKDGTERHANWLVNISGDQLEKEEMIKMPVMLHVTPEQSWKACLREAWQQTTELQGHADQLLADSERYIRPIMLVQVERTGKDQRGGGFVHTDDVREYLIELGVDEAAIAVKTSDEDELKTLENRNLLDPKCPIRVIITKAALQEGWDCSFAYVLCSLAVGRSTTAMTQLVGRILRQPHAEKTGVAELDRCYVYTYRQETKAAVEMVQKGLSDEGMGDLAGRVQVGGPGSAVAGPVRERRDGLREKKFYLPQVLVNDGTTKGRVFDWEVDILGEIDWPATHLTLPEGGLAKGQAEALGGARAIRQDEVVEVEAAGFATEYDPFFALRALLEIVPNAWIAQRWAAEYTQALLDSGWTPEELGQRQQYVVREMVKRATVALDELARPVFERRLAAGEIVFDLVADRWWPVPETGPPVTGTKLNESLRNDGKRFEKTMFPPVYAGELNGLELEFACFTDKQEVVWWWYRNVVKTNGYSIQGWRRNKIYPDFIIAREKAGAVESWTVIETKGQHLYDSPDSEYKRDVMEALTESYATGGASKLGQLTLFEHRVPYVCEMLAETDWESRMREKLKNG